MYPSLLFKLVELSFFNNDASNFILKSLLNSFNNLSSFLNKGLKFDSTFLISFSFVQNPVVSLSEHPEIKKRSNNNFKILFT